MIPFLPIGVLQQQIAGGNGGGGGPSAIVSIEKVTLVITTVTPVQVNLTKGQDETQCVPFFSLMHASHSTYKGSYLDGGMLGVEMYDNAGTAAVRLHVKATNRGNRRAIIYVVEFHSDISVQQISADRGSTSNWTEAITAVDQAKAFIIPTFHDGNTGNYYAPKAWAVRVKFDSDTLVGFVRNPGASHNMHHHTYVVEDKSAGNDFFSVQAVSKASSSTNSTSTISSVDVAATMIVGTFHIPSIVNNFDRCFVRYDLLNATTVRFRRWNTAYVCDNEVFVVEWLNGTTVQRGDKVISTTTTSTEKSYAQSITAVDVALSIVKATNLNPMGFPGQFTVADQGGGPNAQVAKVALELDGDGAGFALRNFDSARIEQYTIPWEVVEFV